MFFVLGYIAILLFNLEFCTSIYNKNIFVTAQLITQPPESTTAALSTNATFSCHGNGEILWEIDGTQVMTEQRVQLFSREKVYVPLPTPSVSELIMTATEVNNFTRTIQCVVDQGIGVGEIEDSDPVYLFVYGKLTLTGYQA